MRALTLIAVVLVAGCGTVKPYASVGLGYQIDKLSHYSVQTSRSNQCSDNVQFHGELGLDMPDGWSVAYHHQSWIFCGAPFNNRAEQDTDDIRITKKFGGRK